MENGKDFDYKKYKIEATTEDVKNLEDKYNPKVWENIPVIGCFGYLIRMGIEVSGIDRGPLRKEITKAHLWALLFGLLYLTTALFILTPYLYYAVLKRAIKKTKEKIDNNKI